MIIHCPFCNLRVKPSDRTCPSCGRGMARACPYCSEQVPANAPLCKYCGEEIEARRESPAAPPDIVFVEEPARRCAWENSNKGVLRRWWGTWWESNTHPGRFFEAMPATGGHRWPVGFAFGLVAQALAAIVLVSVTILGVQAFRGEPFSRSALLAHATLLVAAIPASFLAVSAALYVGAFLWHLLLKVLGSKAPFQATLRVVGYASGTSAWLLLPYAGLVMQPLMQTVLHYHGFRRVHGLSKGRALFAALLPLVLVAGAAALLLFAGGCCRQAPVECWM